MTAVACCRVCSRSWLPLDGTDLCNDCAALGTTAPRPVAQARGAELAAALAAHEESRAALAPPVQVAEDDGDVGEVEITPPDPLAPAHALPPGFPDEDDHDGYSQPWLSVRRETVERLLVSLVAGHAGRVPPGRLDTWTWDVVRQAQALAGRLREALDEEGEQ